MLHIYLKKINNSDKHGFTPLHWASWIGRLNIVEMLIKSGAKINSVNKCM
jgi:ankyrin repeat protein